MIALWEILVPQYTENGVLIHESTHRFWDKKVLKESKGLTLLKPLKGKWVSSKGKHVSEGVIPVRVACSPAVLKRILKFTKTYYQQEAVMAYCISDHVIIK